MGGKPDNYDTFFSRSILVKFTINHGILLELIDSNNFITYFVD